MEGCLHGYLGNRGVAWWAILSLMDPRPSLSHFVLSRISLPPPYSLPLLLSFPFTPIVPLSPPSPSLLDLEGKKI